MASDLFGAPVSENVTHLSQGLSSGDQPNERSGIKLGHFDWITWYGIYVPIYYQNQPFMWVNIQSSHESYGNLYSKKMGWSREVSIVRIEWSLTSTFICIQIRSFKKSNPGLPNSKREEAWLDPNNLKTPNLRRYLED